MLHLFNCCFANLQSQLFRKFFWKNIQKFFHFFTNSPKWLPEHCWHLEVVQRKCCTHYVTGGSTESPFFPPKFRVSRPVKCWNRLTRPKPPGRVYGNGLAFNPIAAHKLAQGMLCTLYERCHDDIMGVCSIPRGHYGHNTIWPFWPQLDLDLHGRGIGRLTGGFHIAVRAG